MATIVNDRDVRLQGATQRSSNPQDAGIVLSTDAPAFHVNSSGVAFPTSIKITANLIRVAGTAVFTAAGATITDNGDNTATVNYSGMQGGSVEITAKLTTGGVQYTKSIKLSKVSDGAQGEDGAAGADGPPGNQYAIAYVYQWAPTAPAKPTGTTAYDWSTGANTGYSAFDNWSHLVPSNPGTPGVRLYVAAMSITAAGGTPTSVVSYANSVVQAWAQNGAKGNDGVAGIQTATATVYQWAATIPASPTGSATYTWSNGSFAAPSGWVAVPAAAPSQNMTLWAARVLVTDSATNSATSFNWTSASIHAAGYSAANGQTGPSGASYVTAYCASATGNATSAPAQTTGKTSLPAANSGGIVGTWSASVPTLTAGQYLYQTDGIYDPTTNKVTWSIPYWSSLKVGSLSAISANLGSITGGDINLGGGKFTVDNNGNAIMRSVSVQDGSGNVILQAGTPLADAYVPSSAKNSELLPVIEAAKTTPSKGAALNDDPGVESVTTWNVPAGVSVSNGAGGSAVGKNYFTCTTGTDKHISQKRRFSIDKNKVYNLTAMLYAAGGNTRRIWLYVNFYDANGNFLSTAWGGSMSGYTYGGLPPVGDWSRQGNVFGAGTDRPIPAEAKEAQIGVWLQYSGDSGTNVQQGAQDIRCEDVTMAYQALAQIANISSDSILSKGEKPDVIQRWDTCDLEKASLTAQSSTLGVSSAAYVAAHLAVSNYLVSLSPYWSDVTTDSPINPATWKSLWNAYYDEKQKLINAMAAKAATVADWIGVGGRPSDDQIRNNLIDVSSWWKRGGSLNVANTNSETTSLLMTGTDTEVAAIKGPRGVNDVVAYCKEVTLVPLPGGGTGPEGGGGWNSWDFNLDPTKTHRFVVPIRRISGSGTAYWGTSNVCFLNSNTIDTNPYFAIMQGMLTDRWYLFIGHIYPAGSQGNNHDSAGVWDCKTRLKVANGTNFNFMDGVVPATVNHRAYQFYASTGAEQAFGRPMINLVDGTEPSIQEFFENPTLGVNIGGKVTNAKDISDNLGTYVSTNVLPGTARTQISDLGIRVYDGSGNLRIKIGQL